jgi:hypothetical protein
MVDITSYPEWPKKKSTGSLAWLAEGCSYAGKCKVTKKYDLMNIQSKVFDGFTSPPILKGLQ